MTVKLIIIAVVVVGLIANSTGDDIVKRLKARFNKAVNKCSIRGKDKPAYECSGILIRGVRTDVKLDYAWGMKDLNKKKEAFSVAFLRKDQKFDAFPRGYDSGFIVYPHSKTPKKKNAYKIFCAFPMDANADRRSGHGCGKNSIDHSQTGGHCHKQNIKSFDKWKTHFNNILGSRDKNFVTRQCAFDMTSKSAAKYFEVALKANQHMQTHSKTYAWRNNELRMHAWSVKKARNIPIEAFFYIIGNSRGKRRAERYQDEFYSRGGGAVPIVGIRLPSAKKSFKVESHKRKPKKVK